MEIQINLRDITPVYEQIVDQIQQAVLDGTLSAKSPLPPIRQLAQDLEINHNTVAKAYQKLEQNNVIVSAGRRGTFIREDAALYLKEGFLLEAEQKLTSLFREFIKNGLPNKTIKELTTKVIKKL